MIFDNLKNRDLQVNTKNFIEIIKIHLFSHINDERKLITKKTRSIFFLN